MDTAFAPFGTSGFDLEENDRTRAQAAKRISMDRVAGNIVPQQI